MYGEIQYCIKHGHDWKTEQRFFDENAKKWMIQRKCMICGCRSLAFDSRDYYESELIA